MSLPTSTGYYRAEAAHADLLKRVGLADGMSVFGHPKIDVWRSITERENCVLDVDDPSADVRRLHIKRNKPGHRGVEAEADAIRLLTTAGIDTVPLVAAGRLNDGRGFLITADLAGFDDADLRVKAGLPFEPLLGPTAGLAGRLHAAGLHHRDLYLCHFYVRVPHHFDRGTGVEARLMDAGRVQRLPRLFRRRWLVKDVAQFVYSLRQSGVAPTVVDRWLAEYATAAGTPVDAGFRRAVDRKVAWIGRHDRSLRQRHPTRNVSIDR